MLGLFVTVLAACYPIAAAPTATDDPCAKIAGKAFVPPADALACEKSFPFNETLRQNVLNNIARVFDFFTFEEFYLDSPPPFQESTSDIRAKLAELNSTGFETDYDFNIAVYDFTTQLNDGHTRWFPTCYTSYQNILPAPFINVEVDGTQGVFIAFDSVAFISLLGSEYTDFFDDMGFDWRRLAGAQVTEIEGQAPYDYVDFIAKTVSGNYLDHGVRVNSVFSSYRISGTNFSQRLGDLAGPTGVKQTSLNVKLIVANSTEEETLDIPFLANFLGTNFTDAQSFWTNNCAANSETNGIDFNPPSGVRPNIEPAVRRAKAFIIDKSNSSAIGLPEQFLPTIPSVDGSSGVIKNFLLPDNETGVMFVGSFSPDDFDQFQKDTVDAIDSFKAAGVTRLLIDLTNNGGGFVCLGQFLFQFLAGAQIGYPGFVSTNRANPLAQKIVAADIALGNDDTDTFYSADNFAFLNDTQMPASFDYIEPSAPFQINGKQDPTSQRFHDTCQLEFSQDVPDEGPFPPENIAIVTNGNCASTCAMFSTLMNERLGTKIAVFGGKPGENVEFKGMAGNQVLEWSDLDSEIKTARVKDDPLAPPDLLVDANMRHNWRTAWSFFNESVPIAYLSELPKFRFNYTRDTPLGNVIMSPFMLPSNLIRDLDTLQLKWTCACTYLKAARANEEVFQLPSYLRTCLCFEMSSASSSSSSFTTFDGPYDLVLETTTPLRLARSSSPRRLYNLSMDSSFSCSSSSSSMSSPSVYSVEDSPKRELESPCSLDERLGYRFIRPLPSVPASPPATSRSPKTLRPLPLPPPPSPETQLSISVSPASPTSPVTSYPPIPKRDVESPYPLLPNPHIHPPPRSSSRHRPNPFSSLSLDVSDDTLAPPAYRSRSKDTLVPAPSPSSLCVTEAPTPTTDRRRRISRLRRRLGDGVPDELIPYKYDADKTRRKSLRETQSQDDLYSMACKSTLQFGGDLESDEEDTIDAQVVKIPPLPSSRVAFSTSRKITKRRPDEGRKEEPPESAPASSLSYRPRASNRISTKWVREKGGRRWEEQDYDSLMNALRAL
ncbi:hypothetical protein D9758_014119 [Tetrapyrgos nigripes]|uniref:Tail specific protease domain-containing protein n=1 Tax=Tetrapyrgos nigripes TaxID=182062 RepID=A0A8H5CD44_9AGAR|nr:hypothetical protein D9758_014119 [Tetrapyrgos nigripes]